jgi:hypothetical protein
MFMNLKFKAEDDNDETYVDEVEESKNTISDLQTKLLNLRKC